MTLPMSFIRKSLLCLGLLSAAPLTALAGDDFGLWTSFGAQKDFSKKFSVEAGLDFRAENKLRSVERWDFSLGATYKPFKFLSLGVGYDFIHQRNLQETKEDWEVDEDDPSTVISNGLNVDHGYWRNKHRAVFDLTGKVSAGRFTFSLRERYQFTHYRSTTTLRDKYRDEIPANMIDAWTGEKHCMEGRVFSKLKGPDVKEKESKNKHYLRSRLQVEYNIKHSPLTLYASFELSNNLSEGFSLDKKRLSVGTEWKITKKHRLEVGYVFQTGADDDDEGDLHAISLGYKFKF